MRVLVLGGNGFIGSHLIDHLLMGGHRVSVIDKQYELFRSALPTIDYHMGEFGNRDLLADVLKDIDMVFHLVSTTVPITSNENPVFDVMSNVIETIKLLEQCVQENVKKFVFISTGGAIYGTPEIVPVHEGSRTNPLSSYGISKLTIEKYLYVFNRLYGLDYVILRPSNPYGPRQNIGGAQGVVSVFLGRIARGQSIDIWGDGTAIKDYIYIDDLIDGIYKAAFQNNVSKIFNLGGGLGVSIIDVVDMIAEVVDIKFKVNYIPAGVYDVSKIVLDVRRAKEELHWSPEIAMTTGIERTWKWVKDILI